MTLLALSIAQFAALLETREGKLRPTSPLHSEGYEVSGLTNVTVLVGFEVPKAGEKKLLRHFLKHRANEKSELASLVGDVTTFLEQAEKMTDRVGFDELDFETIQGNVTGGDEDGDGEDWQDRDQEADQATLSEILKATKFALDNQIPFNQIHFTTFTQYGNEMAEESISRVYVGEEVAIDAAKAADAIQAITDATRKLEPLTRKLKIEAKVIITGNEVSGNCQ